MNSLHILDISSGVLVRNILKIDLLKVLKYRNEDFVLFKNRLNNSTEEKFYYKIKTKNTVKMKIVIYHKDKKKHLS